MNCVLCERWLPRYSATCCCCSDCMEHLQSRDRSTLVADYLAIAVELKKATGVLNAITDAFKVYRKPKPSIDKIREAFKRRFPLPDSRAGG